MLKGSIEDNVLTLLCWSDRHAPDVATRFGPDIFSTREYQRIAKHALSFIEKFGKAPGAHLRDLCEADLRKGEGGKLLKMTLDAMEELAPSIQPDFVLDRLNIFIRTRQMQKALEEASDKLMAEDLEGAQEALYAKELLPEQSPGLKLSDATRALSFLNEVEEDFFSIGVDVLDDLGIRPARKELAMMIAPAKAGKTWWMIEVAKRGFMHRKNVLHVTLEMSEEKVAQRYIQSLYAMSARKADNIRIPRFIRNDLGQFVSFEFDTQSPEVINDESRAAIAKKLRAMGNRAPIIKQFPTGSLTIPQLNAYLDSLEREGFKVDELILDYADLMYLDPNNLRTATGVLYKQLRGIAVQRNLALVTASQGNRQSATAKTVGSQHVAEDWSKIGTADTVFTYSRTKEEKNCNLARLFVSNARNAEDGVVALISQSYATGQFSLDSVYMGKHVEEALREFTGDDDGDSA